MSIAYLDGASFASFVEGPSNAAAAAAARAVTERSSGHPNPLLIAGAAGLGKSHLLAAIAAAVREGDPTVSVAVETAASLAERLRGGQGGVMPLHEAGLLLIDEMDLMVGQPEQESLVLELLLGRVPFGRPVVLAGDWRPTEGGRADPDLVRVIADGAIVTLAAPDPGTRLAILRRRAADLTPALTDEVLTAVAGLPITSVRELLAAIQRLVAFQSVSPTPLDPSEARLLITGLTGEEVPAAEPDVVDGQAAGDGARGGLVASDDEFGSFLSEVVASVGYQVDRWRTQVGEAILRYGGEGFRTRRLESLLGEDMPAGSTEALEEFARDVERLRTMESEAASLEPELSGAAAFRDPDQVPEAEALLAQARMRKDPLPGPSSEFRLERFAEGPGNRPAVQAVRSVAQEPGSRFNPLVLVGASGTGKSHLLHGLGHQLEHARGGAVACITAGGWVGEVSRLGASGGLNVWRARYRHAAALLVDDLHFLVGHPEAQAEFLDLISRLIEGGRQVVVTLTQPLTDLGGIDPRLLTRLEAGLVVQLPKPDREIRLVVAKQMLSGTEAEGDAALADWFAARPMESVRALQGAVRQVVSAAQAAGVAPSPALAREVLDRRDLPPRRSGGHLAAGVPGPLHRVTQSAEKLVTEWPRLADRLIEELG